MSAGARAVWATFALAITLNVAAALLVEPYRGTALLGAFFFVGLGWALWLFLKSD